MDSSLIFGPSEYLENKEHLALHLIKCLFHLFHVFQRSTLEDGTLGSWARFEFLAMKMKFP